MNAAERVVTALCEAFERMNADELIEYFTDDAVYHNIPLPPLEGREQIYSFLKGLPQRYRGLRIETLKQMSAGNLVMNERIDYFDLPDKTVALPIAGVFELENGKIKRWREYFDLGTLRS
jgi:limonene-1,2-epoxide hydrolase